MLRNRGLSRLRGGRTCLVQKDGLLWRAGQGASAKGDRPFLDTWDPLTGKTQRVWQCAEGRYETFAGFLDEGTGTVLSRNRID